MYEPYIWSLELVWSRGARGEGRHDARLQVQSRRCFSKIPRTFWARIEGTFWKFHFRITIAIFWPIKPSWCDSPTLNFITWLSKRSAFQAINKYKKKWYRNLPRSLFSGELKQQRQRWLRKRIISALKKWIYVAANFIALIPSRLIRQMLANFFGVEF